MLNWIVWNKTVFTFNFVNKKFCTYAELFEIEPFDDLTVCKQMIYVELNC